MTTRQDWRAEPVSADLYAQDETDTEAWLYISCDATPAIDQDLCVCVVCVCVCVVVCVVCVLCVWCVCVVCVCVKEPAGSVVFLCEISIRNNFIAYCSLETMILSVSSITAGLSVEPPRAAPQHTHTHTVSLSHTQALSLSHTLALLHKLSHTHTHMLVFMVYGDFP